MQMNYHPEALQQEHLTKEEEFTGMDEITMVDKMESLLDSGLIKNDSAGAVCDSYYGFRSKSERSVDPRVMRVLEFFRELYRRGKVVFEKVVPARHHEEFEELFIKIGSVLDELKSKEMAKNRLHRSLSVGSLRKRGIDGSELKLERFKVRTITTDGGGPETGGHGGQGGGGGGGGIGQTQTSTASK